MRLSKLSHLVLLALAGMVIASRANASIITVPPNLSPGDTYELIFVTADITAATNADIGYYNDFVTQEANAVPELAALGATWKVLGSTETVSAVTNIGTLSGPIYNLEGQEVAANSAALFTTATTPLLNPIEYTQDGTLPDTWVFTGSSSAGDSAYAFGSYYSVEYGLSDSTYSYGGSPIWPAPSMSPTASTPSHLLCR